VLNFAISWWNAYVCGKVWAETKAVGGWRRFMAWVTAVMSGLGFSWCYLIVVALTCHFFGLLTIAQLGIALQLGYVVLAPCIVFACWMITVDSWANAYRNGGILNYGLAGYNAYATIHNTMSVFDNYGSALGDVFGFFTGGGKSGSSSSSDDNGGVLVAIVVIGVVLVALAAGVLTTMMIIKKVAASEELPTLDEIRRRAAAQNRP